MGHRPKKEIVERKQENIIAIGAKNSEPKKKVPNLGSGGWDGPGGLDIEATHRVAGNLSCPYSGCQTELLGGPQLTRGLSDPPEPEEAC